MLRNKYFIIVLAVLLIAVVIYNYYFFATRRAKPAAVPQAAVPAAVKPAAADPNRVQTATYRPLWRRDPFRYDHVPGTGRPHSPRKASSPAKPASGFRFEGTMTEHGKGFALVSGQIVGAGETIDGHTILEIGDQWIKVKSPTGIKTLRLADDGNEKEN